MKDSNKINQWIIWHIPDKRTLFGGIFILLLIVFFFLLTFGFPFNNLDNKKKEYQGVAEDTTISIEPQEELNQSETGNKIMTFGYIIKYSYKVRNRIYYNKTFINAYHLNNKVLENYRNGNYEIRYDILNPEKSMIFEKN